MDKLGKLMKKTKGDIFLLLGLLLGLVIVALLILIAGVAIWAAFFEQKAECDGYTNSIYFDTISRIQDGRMQADCRDFMMVDAYDKVIPSCIAGCGTYDSKLWFNGTSDELFFFYGIYCYEDNTTTGEMTRWCDLNFKKVLTVSSSGGTEGMPPLAAAAPGNFSISEEVGIR